MRARSQKLLWTGIIWLGASLCAAVALSRDLLIDFEARTWDWRLQAIASQVPHNPRIKIVMIDQASLDHFSRREKIFWPWPRSLYVPLLEFLAAGGAQGVAFDMIFSETGAHVDDDELFTDAVKRTIPVVSAVALRSDRDMDNPQECAELRNLAPGNIAQGLGAFRPPRYQSALLPIPELISSSAAVGNVTAEADRDGIFRRVWPGAYCDEVPLINLPFALARLIEPNATTLERYVPVVESSGRLLPRFFGQAGTYDSYSFHALVSSFLKIQAGEKPDVDPQEFKDSYVLVGANAPGLLDLRSIPLGGAYSGVELNATILDNILSNSFLRKVEGWPAVLITAILLALAAGVVVVVNRFQLATACGVACAWIVCAFAGAFAGWWIPLVVPLLGALAVLSLGFFAHYQIEGKQSRFIRNAFQYYVTAEVVDKIIADPSLLALGGERRELTIFFSDIAGFTTLSESMPPADLVRFLNMFLSEMTTIILSEQGTIDKYEGDAIIAFWNAPLTVVDHQERAVRTALRLQARLAELRGTFKKDFGIEPEMRIGITTGFVTVGNFGSSNRFNYTMIGDAANLASRLEGTNKIFGTHILVSEATQGAVSDRFVWRRLGDVQVKGKQEAVGVFEPIDATASAGAPQRLVVFEEALRRFEGGDARGALEMFESLGDDPPSVAYAKRIKSMIQESRDESSVWVLLEK